MNNSTNRTVFGRILLLALAVAPIMAGAQPTPNPPGQISYQGFLTDANGVPLATSQPKNYDVSFRIYNAPSAGVAVWGEIQTVTVDRGYFSVLLGQGAALSGGEPWTNNLVALFTGNDASDRYIGMTVKGITSPDSEIQPRLRLLTSPYSFLAAKANNSVTLGGYDWSVLFPDTGNPTTGTFPGSKIAANSINTAQVAAGAIGTAQIANGAVGAAQIGLPLALSGATSSYFLYTPAAILDVNNTATASFPFFSGPAIHAHSSGANAYLGYGSDAADLYGNVYMSGSVTISGSLSKPAGSFKIDHPLDPANKYLYHSFVESPDMKNIYDGIATLDAKGEVVVKLPAWFDALNRDFRYQLTPIGGPGPNLYIASEVSKNEFKIAGGLSGMKVSWQLTGVRQDAYANAHRIPVEEEKAPELRDHYLYPVELGQPKEKSESAVLHPQELAEQAQPQAKQ